MKIGIDARMLSSAYGIGRYIQQLIIHLDQLATDDEYVIFLRRDNWHLVETAAETVAHAWTGSEKKGVPIRLKSHFRKVLADIPWYSWREQWSLKKTIAAENVDLMHFPHWNVPLNYRAPFVVTIHDLTMFHYARPEATTLGPLEYWIKDRLHRRVVRRAARRAKHLFVTSEFTKQDIHTTLGVPNEKMTVTYQAPFGQEPSAILPAILPDKYDITKPYVLYVGAAYPHKNLGRLIDAWKLFEEEHGLDYQLVLAGPRSAFYARVINRATEMDLKSFVYIANVSDDLLDFLYRQASVFAFPSLYEGFGLPPIEAMSRGVPVVASNRASLPEVLGEGALYIDPEDPQALADALYRVLTDADIREQLISQGRIEANRYSWASLAKKTSDTYHSVKIV